MAEPKRALIYEDFEFDKLSYTEKGGILLVSYYERGGSKDAHTTKSIDNPHPDLLDSMQQLATHYARIVGLHKCTDAARELLRSDSDGLKKILDIVKEIDNSILISEISIIGEDLTKGVKITGSIKCLNGDARFKLPVVRFTNEAMGIEQTIEKLVENIKKEAYGFIFQNKRKQKDMFIEGDEKSGKGSKGSKKQLDLVEESEKDQ